MTTQRYARQKDTRDPRVKASPHLSLGNVFPNEQADNLAVFVGIDNYGERFSLLAPHDKTAAEVELEVSAILKTENWHWAKDCGPTM